MHCDIPDNRGRKAGKFFIDGTVHDLGDIDLTYKSYSTSESSNRISLLANHRAPEGLRYLLKALLCTTTLYQKSASGSVTTRILADLPSDGASTCQCYAKEMDGLASQVAYQILVYII